MSGIICRKRGTLTLQQFPAEHHPEQIHRVRDTYKQVISEKEYEGWSDEYDTRFDEASMFFSVLRNDHEVIGTCRVVEKTSSSLIPLECARLRDSSLRLSLDDEASCAELTWFWFESTTSLKALVSALSSYSAPRYDVVYATFDPELELDRLYRYLNFREIHQGLRITYEGFTRHEEVVQWSVMRIVNEDIHELTQRRQFSPEHFQTI